MSTPNRTPVGAVLLDLDGTLVDSVYVHVITWDQALRAAGHIVPLWRIHAGIGMGSSRLVPWLLGRHVAEAEQISDDHQRRFLDRAQELHPTHGAAALVDDLQRRDVAMLIATSAGAEVRDALLSALGRSDLATTDADDVESSKPAADLLLTACQTLGADPSRTTLVGDTMWDVEAATLIGLRCLAVRTGGFGEATLRQAGAHDIVDDPAALVGRL